MTTPLKRCMMIKYLFRKGGDSVPLIMAIVSSVLSARNSNWQGGSPNLVDNVSTIIKNVGRIKSGSEKTGGS